jgi:hypothetical protein
LKAKAFPSAEGANLQPPSHSFSLTSIFKPAPSEHDKPSQADP